MFKRVSACMLAASLGGCAVGNVGTLVAHVTPHDTMTVVVLHAVGVYVRTRADDPGAHIGYSRRIYAFVGDGAPDAGWFWLHVPLPDRDAVAQDLLVLGLELTAAAPEAGITLGYSRQQVRARLATGGVTVLNYRGDLSSFETLAPCPAAGQTSCAHSFPHR